MRAEMTAAQMLRECAKEIRVLIEKPTTKTGKEIEHENQNPR